MMELNLPHKDPIRFAKYIISRDDKEALVRIAFETKPSLAMLVEAVAQSSAAFGDGDAKMGYLVTIKNIELLESANFLEYDAKIKSSHQIEQLNYFEFEVFNKELLIATGEFIIALK